MFSMLPDLSPRDSHSLWYTSSRNPFQSSNAHDAHVNSPHQEHGHGHPQGPSGNHRRSSHLIERSPLARLRADEQNLERRRQNVTNFGSAWLKPPGLPKTLHQLREERREAEEHQEALRREQLAHELAEAEAEAAGTATGDATGGAGDADAMMDAPAGEDGMDDVQLDGARDLDADIPEAEEADFGLSGDEDEDEEDDEDEEEEEEDDDDEEGDAEARAHAQQQLLMAQRMRQGNDAFREDMARGRDSAAFYGGDEDVDEADQSQMIEEDDLVHGGGDMDDMGMDANLDDEIPEAESLGGYEHTDTEAELSSSVDDDEYDNSRLSFAQPQLQGNRVRRSLARSDATRHSIAISDILSRDGSSVLGSSPAVPRQRIGPTSRRGRG